MYTHGRVHCLFPRADARRRHGCAERSVRPKIITRALANRQPGGWSSRRCQGKAILIQQFAHDRMSSHGFVRRATRQPVEHLLFAGGHLLREKLAVAWLGR
jgi:hypothetical protein